MSAKVFIPTLIEQISLNKFTIWSQLPQFNVVLSAGNVQYAVWHTTIDVSGVTTLLFGSGGGVEIALKHLLFQQLFHWS